MLYVKVLETLRKKKSVKSTRHSSADREMRYDDRDICHRENTLPVSRIRRREETGLRKCYRVRAFNCRVSVYSRCAFALLAIAHSRSNIRVAIAGIALLASSSAEASVAVVAEFRATLGSENAPAGSLRTSERGKKILDVEYIHRLTGDKSTSSRPYLLTVLRRLLPS